MPTMKQLTLGPIRRVEGEVRLPGSKSMTNRMLLLASLATGTTKVYNALKSDDSEVMLDALTTLRISHRKSKDNTHHIVDGAGGPFATNNADLFLGNSGTSYRMLCATVCASQGLFILTGNPRMHERPIADLVDVLRSLGANIKYLQRNGYPPLEIKAQGIFGRKVTIKGDISSQYLTGVLIASPLSKSDVEINVDGELVSKPYIAMTLNTMRRFGIEVDHHNFKTFKIRGSQSYTSPGKVFVEGDASSATYFMSAAAIRGGTVRINGVGTNSIQGDSQYAQYLSCIGANVRQGVDWIEVSKGELHGADVDLNHMPDAAMTAAVTALFANGKTTIRNIYNWRVKETDRLTAMVTELRKVGADVLEGNDFIEIHPPRHIKSATINTYDDHRMAMCFSLAALSDVPIVINDPDCVSKTFPDFFKLLNTITSD